MSKTALRTLSVSTLLLTCLGLSACTEDAGTGDLRVLVEAEDVIIEGLQPGDGAENIRDGWAVDFDRYIVVLGEVDVHLSTDESVEGHAHELYAIDLAAIDAAGESLWTLGDLQEGRWEFNYAVAHASDGAEPHSTVSQADFDAMVAGEWSYLISGTMTKADGVSCPPAALASPPDGATSTGQNDAGDPCYAAPSVSFELGIGGAAETMYGPCEVDEQPGFAITAGSETSVAITIHGDHLFFNGFPEGDEGGVTRLAQWLADCDLDLDGVVTREELEAIAPSDLAELDDRYQLGGSPITPLDNMWTYLEAQLKTQGHFQGEGECPADGVEHDH